MTDVGAVLSESRRVESEARKQFEDSHRLPDGTDGDAYSDHDDVDDSDCETETDANGFHPATPPMSLTYVRVGKRGPVHAPPGRLFATALGALRTNALPGLVLNSFALLLLVLYFTSTAVQSAFEAVADFRAQFGLRFSLVSTLIFGGLIPWIVLVVQEARTNSKRRAAGQPIPTRVPNIFYEGVFLAVLWSEKGVEVDLFYQLQSVLFGSAASPSVVIAKVLVDMFVYNPIWATPSILVAYFWKDSNFHWRPAYDKWRSREYWTFILPSSLITVWCVWLPAVSIIYTLPSALQIPLFNIIICFWAILLQFVTKTQGTPQQDGEEDEEAQVSEVAGAGEETVALEHTDDDDVSEEIGE